MSPQDRSGQVRKISPPQGFDPRTVQPVASRYTDYAIPVHPIQRVFTYLSIVLWPIRLNEARVSELTVFNFPLNSDLQHFAYERLK